MLTNYRHYTRAGFANFEFLIAIVLIIIGCGVGLIMFQWIRSYGFDVVSSVVLSIISAAVAIVVLCYSLIGILWLYERFATKKNSE